MTNWLPGGRDKAGRVEALEVELERLRAQASADAKRLDEATAAVRETSDLATTLLRAMELRLARLEILADKKDEEADAAKEKAADEDQRFVTLQTAVKRAERQIEHYAEEARKTGAALLERIERMRREYET